MQFSKHVYAICGLGLILTAVSVGSNKASTLKTPPPPPPQSVLVANSSVPVTVNGISSIQVTNKKSEGPLVVRDVDVYARVPQQGHVFGSIEEPATGDDVIVYTAPSGKRLVVQTLVIRGSTPSGAQALSGASTTVRTPSGNFELLMPVKMEPTGTNFGGFPFFYGSAETPIYVGPLNSLVVTVTRNETTGNANFLVAFTGYLEDVPPVP